jgi:Purple acid Phosphatase, N-terminal domain/Calcineurin-like phosphoesterase
MTPEQAGRLSVAEQHEWFARAATTSRSPGSRSTARRGAARQVAPALLARPSWPGGSVLPPYGAHIAFGAEPTTQMSVTWQVAAPVDSPFLRVGSSPWDLGGRIAAEIRTVTTARTAISPHDPVPPAAGAIEQYYVHALVSGLRPGQAYYYSIGHHGWERAPAGPAGTFTTAPRGREPFTFTAFGDQGVGSDAVSSAALVNAQSPAFHLHAGDISYAESGGRGLITDAYDPRAWDSFFTELEPVAGQVPWQIAVGNHELEAWYSADGYAGQRARFALPAAGAGQLPPTYYSFVYGNVGIISLDANDVSCEIPANHGYSGGAQTRWLARTLSELRSNPGVDFIVAYFHHCAYSSCTTHGSDAGPRQAWVPLFDLYGVDLVINGHNHVFERTDPLRGGVSSPAPTGATITPATQGTTYITAGGGGVNLYGFAAADSHARQLTDTPLVISQVHGPDGMTESETVGWSRVRYTGYCLLVVASQPGGRPGATSTLTVRGLAADGTELDRVTLARWPTDPLAR